jgi:hypothetical protein
MFKSFVLKKKIKKIKNAIKNLSLETINEKIDINIVKDIWKNNKIIYWLRSNGIEIVTPPPYSLGGSGIAYFLPNNMVLKITDDIVEANVAKMLIKSKIKHTMIDVVKINNLYLILQQKLDLKKTSEDMKTAADLVTVMIDDNSLEEFPDNKELLKNMCIKTIKENNFPISILDKMLLIIDTLKEIEKTTGYFHDDAGPTNIGTKDGRAYVFDLGPNKTKGYNPLERIEKIKTKRAKLGLSDHEFE